MPFLPFAKVIPGGNATILLDNAGLSPRALAAVAPELMGEHHLQAEQVGQISRLPEASPPAQPPLSTQFATHHLQMMGNEFCVNATRAAAAYMAYCGEMAPVPVSSGTVSGPNSSTYGCFFSFFSVSGQPDPLPVFAALNEPSLFAGLDCFAKAKERFLPSCPEFPVKIPHSEWFTATCIPYNAHSPSSGGRIVSPQAGVYGVQLPGITHLLVDTAVHGLPEQNAWKQESARWRQAHESGSEAAFGVIWYTRMADGYSILPAVFVRAINSEFLETACGSASLAVALLHKQKSKATPAFINAPACPSGVSILQPSGKTLTVLCTENHAWVIGPTLIAAHGITWCH